MGCCSSTESTQVPVTNTSFEQKEKRILYIILAYSNPYKFHRRKELLLKTHQELIAKKHELDMQKGCNDTLEVVTSQIAYDDEPFIEFSDNTASPLDLKFRTSSSNILWCKENLVNLAIRNILKVDPENAFYFANVDADITFENPSFVTDTLNRLHPKAFLQMFDKARLENPVEMKVRSFGYQYINNGKQASAWKSVANDHKDYWHPGFAWALHRDVFVATGGLIDRSYGSADRLMAMCLVGRGLEAIPKGENYVGITKGFKSAIELWEAKILETGVELGYVPGTIFHAWHGSLQNRQYMGRWDTIAKYEFDPEIHMQYNPVNGLLEWTSSAPENLKAEVAAYFQQRNEDEPMPPYAKTKLKEKKKKKDDNNGDDDDSDDSSYEFDGEIGEFDQQNDEKSNRNNGVATIDNEHKMDSTESRAFDTRDYNAHHSNAMATTFPAIYAGGI